MKQRLFPAAIFLLFCSIGYPQSFQALVTDVIKGNAITIQLDDFTTSIVFVHGIDCEDLSEASGRMAQRLTSTTCLGKTITIEPVGVDDKEEFWANVISPEGKILSHELVKAGYAWRAKNIANEELSRLESTARVRKEGFWRYEERLPDMNNLPPEPKGGYLSKENLLARQRAKTQGTAQTVYYVPSSSYYDSDSGSSGGGTVHVKGYTRKDGTYVKPHTRSAPRR